MADEKVQQAKLRFGIVGNNPQLERAIWRALKVAPIDVAVLVTGESGTGKEFFPQIIHAFSPRKHARYIAVNCGAIPEGTIDSELFGHEKGAFTGAVATRNVDAREPFRHVSYAGLACFTRFTGLGFEGYRQAVLALKDRLNAG